VSPTHARLPAQACSLQSRGVAEPLAGTAPQAQIWILVEQPGPWGRKALRDSQLPLSVAGSLRSLDAQPDVKVLLARHSSRPSRSDPVDRYVWVSRSDGRISELFQAHVANATDLEAMSFVEIANGSLGSDFRQIPERFAFVCTHSGRDTCCAVLGRGLVDRSVPELSGKDSLQVWECSHIGGHRFAPTALLAPINTVVGRCDAHTIHAWVETEHVVAQDIRGASWLDPRSQAVHAYILETHSDLQPNQVQVELADERSDNYRVQADDGRQWIVQVESTQLSAARPESCGGEPIAGQRLHITGCDQLQ
jgi:hypothetical protein